MDTLRLFAIALYLLHIYLIFMVFGITYLTRKANSFDWPKGQGSKYLTATKILDNNYWPTVLISYDNVT